MGVSFLSRNSNFAVARETPPKPSGCPCEAQKDSMLERIPFGAVWRQVQEMGAVNWLWSMLRLRKDTPMRSTRDKNRSIWA
jgi:hypothetical protein